MAAILGASVTANPHNVLSAFVAVRVQGADSVAIYFRPSDMPGGEESRTPFAPVQGDSATVLVLGLEANRGYTMRVAALGRGRQTAERILHFTTGSLPADLPSYSASGPDPSPGHVVLAAGSYGLVIDNSGRVVWYRHFVHGPGLNFVALATGHYAARPSTPLPGDSEPWIVFDASGHEVRTVTCALGLKPRVHELIALNDGSFWLLCDDTRTIDLSPIGGVSGARVMGTAIQHVGAEGELLFHWTPFDHFDVADVEPDERDGTDVNWTHANAIDFDADSNLIVSFRNLGEIAKIDRSTGAVLWRMGGTRNEFIFLDTPLPAFSGQHSVRICADGVLLLLDNTGNPLESRAERYVIDGAQRTARLVGSFGSPLRALTLIGGSVQFVSEARMLVSFGTAGRVEEYDSTGRLMWQIDGNPGYVFRAQRIRSLYAPGVGTPR